MKNSVHLVTYVDRLSGGGIADLGKLLSGPLRGLFGGVHLLPFFHPIDGADAGFDPIDHTKVDPRLGTWNDVAALAAEWQVMADLIVNHISSRAPQFQDFLRSGSDSAYRALFLSAESVFPQGASRTDLEAIYRPRPGIPFTRYSLESGESRLLWTTFTPEQIDIDVLSSPGTAYLERILGTFAQHHIRSVRLDAVGYAIKKAGTSCFLLPETLQFISNLAHRAHELGIEVLVEVHCHYRRQIELARHVPWVYDFALPPLMLHAFAFRTAKYLREWIGIRPANAVTVLDTHDGIGILDIGPERSGQQLPGLVPAAELDQLVEWIHQNSGGDSRRATGVSASNLDLYQVNCTFFDALGRDELSYLLARAVQFFLPGIPQVYYVGLLAGQNDLELLAKTGVGRDINRHFYTAAELARALERPVVQDLTRLIRLRSSHPAFAGHFQLEPAEDDSISLRWRCAQEFAHLQISFARLQYTLEVSVHGEVERMIFSSALRVADD
ncbi:MAG TPA: sucrose phosphorylase [Steroidobacteraceae bacterium]